MKLATKTTKITDIKRAWHHVDVKGKILGRATTQIAGLLMGKSKPYFVRNLDCGDYVVVTNVKEVAVTGRKEDQKVYYRYSGYPGGLSSRTLREHRVKNPEEIMRHAVKGMLPQNKLRDTMLKRLYVFAGEDHPYKDKIKQRIENSK